MKRYMSSEVICPYYHNEDGASLYCEGATDDGTAHSIFRSGECKNRHKERYCLTYEYGGCPVARAAEEKYREDEKK